MSKWIIYILLVLFGMAIMYFLKDKIAGLFGTSTA